MTTIRIAQQFFWRGTSSGDKSKARSPLVGAPMPKHGVVGGVTGGGAVSSSTAASSSSSPSKRASRSAAAAAAAAEVEQDENLNFSPTDAATIRTTLLSPYSRAQVWRGRARAPQA